MRVSAATGMHFHKDGPLTAGKDRHLYESASRPVLAIRGFTRLVRFLMEKVMNAPKKIWFDIDDCSAGPVQFADDEISYIRADIVDALVEALKWIDVVNAMEYEYRKVARAALKKLEESHD